jgi:type IV pilus assembly protein PilM
MPGFFDKLAGMFSGSGTAVGLSIGSSSIKLAELSRSGRVWKLVHFGVAELPKDAIINREIMNPIAVTEGIKTLINQMQLKTQSVCTALSGTSVIIKKMTLEVPNLRELQELVFWEAEQYLPFDVSEVVMDYHMVSRAKNHQTEVIFIAVKKVLLDSYMDCISGAGLTPSIVDADFFALQNLFEANYPSNPSESVAIIDLGAVSMKSVVVSSGVPIFTKDSAIGGAMLTEEIQKALNLPYSDAEALKVGGGEGVMPQEVIDLMAVMAENVAGEVKKMLDFYGASSAGPPITSLLLTGGGSKIPDLSRMIEEQVALPTQILNPFNAISYDPQIFTTDYLNQIAPIVSVPMGLALRAGGGKS